MKSHGKYLFIVAYLLYVLGGIGCSTIPPEPVTTEERDSLIKQKVSDETYSMEEVGNISMASAVVLGVLIISNPVFLLSVL